MRERMNNRGEFKMHWNERPDLEDITPVGDIEHEVKLMELRRAVENLPVEARQVISMYYLEGSTVLDIAAELDISQDAVYKRLIRAKESLKELLV